MVLPILLALAQRVVRIDVLYIGSVLPGRFVVLWRVLTVWRVTLRHVDAFVACKHRNLVTVVVRAAEVVVVVICRVGKQLLTNGIGQRGQRTSIQLVPECHVRAISLLLFVVQTIQTEVLLLT